MSSDTSDFATPHQASPRVFWVLVLIALVIGSGLRLYGLNEGSLWIDEIYTVRDASDLFAGGRPTRFTGYIPTGVVLWASGFQRPEITIDNVHTWREKGLKPWHIRLAPAMIGILSIPLLALAVRRSVRDDWVGGVFALLLAFAPWHLFWSQLGRYYTLKFLCLGLAFAWYYRGTRQHQPKYVVMACVALFFAFLVHPIALPLGAIFLADIGASYLRRKPIRIGKAGWIAAVSCVALAALTLTLETLIAGNAYEPFMGETKSMGQSAPLVFAGAFYMIQLPVLICAAAAIFALKRRGDAEHAGVYWLLVGLTPIVLIALLGKMGTFVQARYAFDALFGFLVLASLSSVMAWRALAPTHGRLFAAAPGVLILAGNVMLIAQHHTTGHHLHRDWASAYDYVREHRQEGEHVVAQRPEIAMYYLGEPGIVAPPSRRFLVDEAAQGKSLWVVDLGASSIKNHPWAHADHADLRGVYPIRVWQPYSELHVYYYTPREKTVWITEQRAAEVE